MKHFMNVFQICTCWIFCWEFLSDVFAGRLPTWLPSAKIYIVWVKRKRKPRFSPKSLKIKKKNHDFFFQWMIAYLFFFYMVHWSFILGQGWLLCNNFCKACQNCLHPSFEVVYTVQCGCMNCCFVVKAHANAIM